MEQRRAILAAQAYIPVKSLISTTGKAYIELNRKFNSKHRYVFEANFTNCTKNQLMFYGCRGQNTYYPINSSFTYISDWRPIFYGGTTLGSSVTGQTMESLQSTWNEWQHIEIKVFTGVFTITNSGGTHTNVPGSSMQTQLEFESTETPVLFNCSRPSGRNFATCPCAIRLYKEYDANDQLITDLRPYKRMSDGKLGMLDLVTKTFFPDETSDLAIWN